MSAQPMLFDPQARRGQPYPGARPQPADDNCPTCGAPVIVALLGGVMPAIAVDPVALTPLGELQAITAGRRTVEQWQSGLDLRSAWHIAGHPAGADDREHPVRPEHRCGSPPPDHVPDRRQPASIAPDLPPF